MGLLHPERPWCGYLHSLGKWQGAHRAVFVGSVGNHNRPRNTCLLHSKCGCVKAPTFSGIHQKLQSVPVLAQTGPVVRVRPNGELAFIQHECFRTSAHYRKGGATAIQVPLSLKKRSCFVASSFFEFSPRVAVTLIATSHRKPTCPLASTQAILRTESTDVTVEVKVRPEKLENLWLLSAWALSAAAT